MQLLKPEFTHSDHRRTIQQLFTFPVKQINSYQANKGAVLGNHYHRQTREFFLITKGTVFASSRHLQTKMLTEFAASKGSLFVVEPYENHTIEVLSDEAQMLTFLTRPYQQNDTDTFKVKEEACLKE